MSVDQNKAAVQRAIEIFDTLDANALEEVFTRSWLRVGAR